MKDLKKMDIEDIDKHIFCYKLLFRFLRQEKVYKKFINILFISTNRSIYDLFEIINRQNPSTIIMFLDEDYPMAYRKWSAIFNCRPFFGHYWDRIGLDIDNMHEFCKRWYKFLENNIEI